MANGRVRDPPGTAQGFAVRRIFRRWAAMSRILITGASGFIGRNLASQLGSRHELAAPHRAELDLLDAERVRSYLRDGQFDVVIHAATERSNRAQPGGAD